MAPLPLTKTIATSFYIDFLYQHKIKVEYWDISSLFYGNVKLIDSIKPSYLKKISSFDEFKRNVQAEDKNKTIFVAQYTLIFDKLKLSRYLTKSRCIIGFFENIALPLPKNPYEESGKNFPQKIYEFLRRTGEKRFLQNYILTNIVRIYQKFRLVKKYDFVFAAGNVGINKSKGKSRIIAINHFDFDRSLSSSKTFQKLPYKYAVFIDDFLVFSPDAKMLKLPTPQPKPYFRELNLFFSKLESQFGLKVVIAAHPKSNYEPWMFENRPLIKYQTNELVKDCEFCLTHYSTALSFGVLHKKPIVLFYTSEMEKIYATDYIAYQKYMASILNCTLINLRKDLDKLIQIKGVDTKSYDQYKYDYLTSKQSETAQTQEILLRFFSQVSTKS